MAVRQANGDSTEYFRTVPDGNIIEGEFTVVEVAMLIEDGTKENKEAEEDRDV